MLFRMVKRIDSTEWATWFMAWLGVFAVLVTLNMEALEHEDSPWASLCSPFIRLSQEAIDKGNPEPIKLSELSQSISSAGAQPRPVYVFALDISKSLDKELAERDREKYLLDIMANPLFEDHYSLQSKCEAKGKNEIWTIFDLSKLEACRMIKTQIPHGSEIHILSFGDQVHDDILTIPPNWHENGRSQEVIDAINQLSELHADDNNTDFGALFAEIPKRFSWAADESVRLHMIIISDFIHDVKQESDENEENRLPKLTYSELARRLSTLSKFDLATFHLLEVDAGSATYSNVLPVVSDQLETFAYRHVLNMPGERVVPDDFLQPYKFSKEKFEFYYSGDGRPKQASQLLLDHEGSNADIYLALTSHHRLEPRVPFHIEVSDSSNKSTQGILAVGRSGLKVRPRSDSSEKVLSLLPKTLPPHNEVQYYRLLISGLHLSKGRGQSTLTVEVSFKKRLNLGEAVFLAVTELCLLITGIGWISSVISNVALVGDDDQKLECEV